MAADKTTREQQKKAKLATDELREAEDAEIIEADESEESRGVTAAKGRATPSRRQREEELDEPQRNFFQRLIFNLRDYFEGVRGEIQKISWPTRAEVRRLTIIVLVALVISSIVLGTIAGLFTELFRLGLTNPLLILIFMAGGAVALFFIGRYFNRTTDSRF
ncbi:MAG: preprotein translocase subunit SecE [Pleurocapsa minor GSE-CHR-MK-17-07R]|jgi:preprotein translocase subunit SecE|nr:preprotein translocase subunit SecE [Pleurocapsa minor GSE-CHR-MK 17-07R]